MNYAELIAASNFSFLRGASHPDEMVLTAKALGLDAIAIADRNSCAGLVRAHKAAKDVQIRFLPAVRLVFMDGFELVAYPTDRASYGRLTRLLTLGNRRAPKGECHLNLDDFLGHSDGLIAAALSDDEDRLERLSRGLGKRLYLALIPAFRGDDRRRFERLARKAQRFGLKLLGANDALYHVPERRILQDVVTCIREGCRISEAGFRLEANAERHLKSAAEMHRLLRHHPEAIAAGHEIAALCRFSLDELKYEYPICAPEGSTPQQELERRTAEGAVKRYPAGVPDKVRLTLEHELALIGQLNYAPYFLTVDDIMRFAREKGILAQGRGSAANSAVCYCLGITAVDPARIDLLFERFVSTERREPPDIDVDFEHERREEVIQHIYERYGRDRAGIAATVITYRARSAIREVGKVLGLSLDMVGALSGTVWGWSGGDFGTDRPSGPGVNPAHVREAGLDPDDPTLKSAITLARELTGFPRHLSQHVGGFVLTQGPLDEVVPIGNAAMADRTFVEWDKDDLDTLGILKIDVLALGMLTCIAKSLAFLKTHKGLEIGLSQIPAEDPNVYDMICKADTIGVFQIESRAQMSMLPRLKPRCFYDLVIEVAIVRPGPIQGDMVHPYLRRRDGKEPVSFPSKDLEQVLGKTLGVPLFQEQAMKIAIVAAGFTPAEADRLRRAMATFRHSGMIHAFGAKLVEGMVARGYERDFAMRCFSQIEGFGEYGFPESHAASFALLVYVSSWIKHYHPEVFAAALINSQPMGFYAPAQILRDAALHGVELRPIDVNASAWDCTLEDEAVRLGFRLIKGLSREAADRLIAHRQTPFESIRNLRARAKLSRSVLARLAEADAFRSLGIDRRQAKWQVEGLAPAALPLFQGLDDELIAEETANLPAMNAGTEVALDYAHLKLSLKAHPLSFLRARFAASGFFPLECLNGAANGARISVAGLVTIRQRPGTAKGVIFATLEDETANGNIVIWNNVFEAHRRIVLAARAIGVHGTVQREGMVVHLVAQRLEDLTPWLADIGMESAQKFPDVTAPADHVRNNGADPREVAAARLDAARQRAAKILYPSRDFH